MPTPSSCPLPGWVLPICVVSCTFGPFSDFVFVYRVFTQEPELPNVQDEDKVIVRNVLYVTKMCLSSNSGLDNWSVNVGDRGYTINVYFAENDDVVVTLRDLQTIQEVNPLRVASASVVQTAKNPTSIRVFVTNKNQPLALTETDVVRVRKRRV